MRAAESPCSAAVKLQALIETGAHPPGNHRFVAVRLSNLVFWRKSGERALCGSSSWRCPSSRGESL